MDVTFGGAEERCCEGVVVRGSALATYTSLVQSTYALLSHITLETIKVA